MKFMTTWRIPPGNYKTSVEIFLEGGAPLPDGLKRIGRWHALGSNLGWHLMEGDPVLVAEHVAEWADLLEIDVSPVLEDEDAGTAAAKVNGG